MPSISAIIVNYNAGQMLRELVTSLLRLSSVAKVIVIDNYSTDHSMDGMEQIDSSQLRLTCIRNKANLGFAKGCNLAIPITESEYLLFLNPDCLINNDALEILLACIRSSPRAAMVGPLLLNQDGTEQAGGRRAVPTPWRSFVRTFGLFRFSDRYPRLFSDFLLHQQPLPDGPIEVEAISGSCMLVRRKALMDIGPLDEGYFMHCEDLDLCMRFRQKGWKIIFVPAARVIHHQGTCSKTRPIFVEWHKHKGMMRFYRKFFHHQYPGLLLWIVGVGVWMRFSAIAVYHSVRYLKRWLSHEHL